MTLLETLKKWEADCAYYRDDTTSDAYKQFLWRNSEKIISHLALADRLKDALFDYHWKGEAAGASHHVGDLLVAYDEA